MEEENLSIIGISPGEIKVYSALLELGIGTIQKIQEQMKNGSIAKNFISVTVAVGKKDKTFKIFVNGICNPIAMQDIKDLFYTPMVKYHVVENANNQEILFHPSANAS